MDGGADATRGLPMLPPPAPTFRAPTRESVLLQMGTRPSSFTTEEDLSFMDAEIKRLHRDMASMLATASPLPKNSSLPAPNASLAAAHGSPGDSDFDCSDDEPALSVLRDELRTTTERFFEREPGHDVGVGGGGGGRGGGRGGERRRAYSVLTPKLSAGGAPMQQKSWNALNDLEKGVEGFIRRSASPGYRACDRGHSDSLLMVDGGSGGGGTTLGSASPPNFPLSEGFSSPMVARGDEADLGGGGSGGRGKGGGGGTVTGENRGADLDGSGCAKVPSSGTGSGGDVGMPADPHLSLAYAKTLRWLNMPSAEETSCNTPNSSPMRGDEFGGDSIPRPPPLPLRYPGDAGPSADSEMSQEDLKARSEEATRTLEALKVLLVEEGRHGEATAEDDGGSGSGNGDRDSGLQGRRQPSKLWPTRGAKRPAPGGFARQNPDTADLSAAKAKASAAPGTPSMAASGGGGGNSGSGDVSSHVPQLLQAMNDLQNINAELVKALRSTPMDESDRGHHRLGSLSTPRPHHQQHQQQHQHQRPQRTRRPGPGPRQRSARMQPSGLLERQSRSSSELLRRRHTRLGQAEPMSCGVPRHRVQVCKQGEDVVFFELAITQAKSTWTLERRMDEFLELRRSLVATATELAVAELAAPAAGAAATEGIATAAQEERGGPVGCGAPRDAERKHKSASTLDAVNKNGGGRRDCLREGEARVPELPCEYNGRWFGTSRLLSLVSARKREEKMMEKQVLLASWLANVLADRELMSPDLVRFLGGDYGGMQAQPVVADVVDDGVGHHSRVGGGGGGDGLAADDLRGDAGLFEVSDDDCATVDDSDDDSDEVSDDDEGEDGSEDDLAGELDSLRGSLCAPDEWALEVTAGVAGGIDSGGSDARCRLEKAMGKRVAIARAGSGSPMFPVGGAVLPLEAMRDSRRVGGVAGSDRNLGSSGAEGAGLEGEGGRGGGEGGGDVTVRSFSETFSPSLDGRRGFTDVPKERRQSGPSPSSPSRRVTLDVFFRVPT